MVNPLAAVCHRCAKFQPHWHCKTGLCMAANVDLCRCECHGCTESQTEYAQYRQRASTGNGRDF